MFATTSITVDPAWPWSLPGVGVGGLLLAALALGALTVWTYLGVAQARLQPVWDAAQEGFLPRLMVPLCLSYDHRVIDGALAARFTAHLAHLAADVRRLSL